MKKPRRSGADVKSAHLLHKDPIDRILIAQAKAEGLPLVTSDSSIGEYPIETLGKLSRSHLQPHQRPCADRSETSEAIA